MITSIKQIYALSIGFLMLIAFVVFKFPVYYGLLIPAALIFTALFIFSLDKILLLIAFCTPLSVKIMLGTAGINLPDEPMMFAFSLVFFLKLWQEPSNFKTVFKSPLTIGVLMFYCWLIITSLSSSIPLVSLKFLLAHFWFIATGFLWGFFIFQQKHNIKNFIISYGLGLCLIIYYTSIRHWQRGFSQKSGTFVMTPFFDDHTVYSAVCAMIFVFAMVLIIKGRAYLSTLNFIFLLMIAASTTVGILLSYSRAAWLSIIITLGFALLIKLRLRFKTIIIGLVIAACIALIFQNQIYQTIRFNKSASGKTLEGDLKSISNISTDDSNVERLNRWKSAWRMFQEKPFWGYGPGTYQFQYSGYQRAHEMTSISTTTGDMGGIHSEYLRPLIESGVVGLLTFLMLVFTVIKLLLNVIYQSPDKQLQLYALAVLLSLSTYLIHGFLNNFLDQDKAALVFWALLGMTGAIYHQYSAKRQN
ncbi:putative bicarbonate transporter, IctB family [Pedobacter glucosidilyticus]|nr:O-antigen ligase family protein [Pedobacter glucosidilyticus]KHJ37342.1 putative bicarbonate transporter, IctB family [Pedobacter glucosidilyticus]